MDDITLDEINANRKNEIPITFRDQGTPINITGYVVYFSVLGGSEEKFNVKVENHDKPENGKTIIEIDESISESLVDGVYYEWELSLVDPLGNTWGREKGTVQAVGFSGTVT